MHLPLAKIVLICIDLLGLKIMYIASAMSFHSVQILLRMKDYKES